MVEASSPATHVGTDQQPARRIARGQARRADGAAAATADSSGSTAWSIGSSRGSTKCGSYRLRRNNSSSWASRWRAQCGSHRLGWGSGRHPSEGKKRTKVRLRKPSGAPEFSRFPERPPLTSKDYQRLQAAQAVLDQLPATSNGESLVEEPDWSPSIGTASTRSVRIPLRALWKPIQSQSMGSLEIEWENTKDIESRRSSGRGLERDGDSRRAAPAASCASSSSDSCPRRSTRRSPTNEGKARPIERPARRRRKSTAGDAASSDANTAGANRTATSYDRRRKRRGELRQ